MDHEVVTSSGAGAVGDDGVGEIGEQVVLLLAARRRAGRRHSPPAPSECLARWSPRTGLILRIFTVAGGAVLLWLAAEGLRAAGLVGPDRAW